MPIYEFRCGECDDHFEELVSLASAENGGPACPRCGARRAERLLSAFSFVSSGGNRSASLGKGCDSCARTSCADCG